MENLRSYSTYYYSEKHPLKEAKYQFKKILINSLLWQNMSLLFYIIKI